MEERGRAIPMIHFGTKENVSNTKESRYKRFCYTTTKSFVKIGIAKYLLQQQNV